jgi:membrane-bound metal-dependent hydrolase YbcI (DUF457 family)
MTSARVSRLHRGLTASLVTVYLLAAVIGLFSDDVDGKVLWVSFLVGGAALIVIGSFLRRLPPSFSLALIAIGATAGALPLVWTFVVPLAAAVLVALSFSLARRTRTA